MASVIVGSAALMYFGISPRIPKDEDLWSTQAACLIGYTGKLDVKIIPLEIFKLIPTIENRATPDAVYTIKRSHAMYDIHWDKTINDIIYLQRKGCKLIPELHNKLCEYWKTIHGDKSFLSLNKTKEEFFDDYVNYEIDHDLLHSIVSKPNTPLYNKCLKDGQDVLIDKKKFSLLSSEEKINLFREEIKVIALERWLIPSKFRIPVIKAYRLSLKKTITNLTKGWATQFILDNIEKYVRIDNPSWVLNYYNYIGKEVKMHPIIEKIQKKAEELGVEDDVIEENLGLAYGEGPVNGDDFGEFLKSLGFKILEHEGGEGHGDSAYTVIEVEGQVFRMDYGYASYDGFYVDDMWDWKPVKAVQKTITFYE